MAKYDPLGEYFRALPEQTHTIELSFGDVEEALGADLPPTAFVDRPWWANTLASNHGRQWVSAGWIVSQLDLDGRRVVFSRTDGQPLRPGRRAAPLAGATNGGPSGKYAPLADFLRSRPDSDEEIVLSFNAIAAILGEDLPPSATAAGTTWWANTMGLSHAAQWLSAGWRVGALDTAGRSVTFERLDVQVADGVSDADNGDDARQPLRRGTKYAPLTEFLLAQPADVHELPMTFAQIEEVIGTALPPCTGRNFKWWSNTRSLRQGRSWLSAGWAVRRLDLDARRLVFVREAVPDPPGAQPERPAGPLERRRSPGRHSKYEPLGEYFRSIPEDEAEVTLCFEDIEEIIGAALPPTAYREKVWWANAQSSHHARYWLDAGWELSEIDMEDTLLGFTRTGSEVHLQRSGSRRGRKGAYNDLREFLQSVPAQQEQLALTFSEMEKIMRSRLSTTARNDRSWWANTDSERQTNTWVQAGWLVDQVYLSSEVIVFRRPMTDVTENIREYVKALLDDTTHMARPDCATLCRWLRLCKQLGWHFEGVMLFERCGVALDGADEAAVAAAEEDYYVCKRELTRYREVLIQDRVPDRTEDCDHAEANGLGDAPQEP